MVEAKWYAIQTYSGHENKVQRPIQRRIDDEPGELEEKQIQDVQVPTQEVVEPRNGKRVTVTRRLYPGYCLVKMIYNQKNSHLINNIQGVIKFLGTGAEPQVSTTVASATPRPSRLQSSAALRMSSSRPSMLGPPLSPPSCPALCRASTSFLFKAWMAGT